MAVWQRVRAIRWKTIWAPAPKSPRADKNAVALVCFAVLLLAMLDLLPRERTHPLVDKIEFLEMLLLLLLSVLVRIGASRVLLDQTALARKCFVQVLDLITQFRIEADTLRQRVSQI